jgi:hypothetical protein
MAYGLNIPSGVTGKHGIHYPLDTDNPEIPNDIQYAVLDIESHLVGIYTGTTDRTTRNGSPTEGEVGYMKDTNTLVAYDGSAWVTISAPTGIVNITSGPVVPANTSGNNGDVFFRV